MALDPVLETDDLSGQDITSELQIGSRTLVGNRRLTAVARLTNLNASAATFTVSLVVDDFGAPFAFYSFSKKTASDTTAFAKITFDVSAVVATSVTLNIESTNASDTNVTTKVQWWDDHQVDTEEIEGADPTDTIQAAVAAALDDATASGELSSVPAATASLRDQLQLIFQKIRNKETATASAATISKDDGTAIGTATLTDDNTTFTKGEYA